MRWRRNVASVSQFFPKIILKIYIIYLPVIWYIIFSPSSSFCFSACCLSIRVSQSLLSFLLSLGLHILFFLFLSIFICGYLSCPTYPVIKFLMYIFPCLVKANLFFLFIYVPQFSLITICTNFHSYWFWQF